jgi:hypothetical protein
MDRTSFRVATLVATALLAIAWSAARADPAAAQSDGGTPAAEANAMPVSSTGDTASDEGALSGEEVTSQEAPSALNAPQNVTSVQEEIQPSPTPSDPPPSPPANTPENAPDAPTAQEGGAGDPPARRIDETPPAASESQADEASAFAASTSSADPSTEQSPEPAAAPSVSVVTPIKPEPVGEVGSVHGSPQPGDSLEQLLTDFGRELRNVHGQVGDLQQRLNEGAPPRGSRLIELRETLIRIAPMLVALQARLDAAGRLSPHLRDLLRRVRSDLRGVRVTAAVLVAALRRSGADGAELRLLLRELEHFRALGSALASNPAVAPVQPPSVSGASPIYAPVQPAAAVAPPHTPAETLERSSTDRQGPGSRDGRGGEEPPPWSSAPGSATASPGGAFFFAGAASLTMLLIGLALPALRARLEVPSGRRYAVAFLAPLERPG